MQIRQVQTQLQSLFLISGYACCVADEYMWKGGWLYGEVVKILSMWKHSFTTMNNGVEDKKFGGFRNVNELFHMH